MKIYSKFQDYYDSALGSFVDSDVVYNRKQETAVFPLSTIPNLGKEFFPKYTDHEILDHRRNPEENIVILVQNISEVSVFWALVRGFGSGLVHGLCTVMVGYGISYIKKRKKLFFCGTFALLSAAIIYHATYNLLVQSTMQYAGILLPILTYIPALLLLRKPAQSADKPQKVKNTSA